MKITPGGGHFICQFSRGEQTLFNDLLQLYPCISATTGLPGSQTSSAQLLEEALAEQRAENKKRVQKFLQDQHRFKPFDKGVQFSVSTAELEWLLQILNDVRVGSWIILGSPEERLELNKLDEKTAPHFWAMEMAGHFEMQLLAALES